MNIEDNKFCMSVHFRNVSDQVIQAAIMIKVTVEFSSKPNVQQIYYKISPNFIKNKLEGYKIPFALTRE